MRQREQRQDRPPPAHAFVGLARVVDQERPQQQHEADGRQQDHQQARNESSGP